MIIKRLTSGLLALLMFCSGCAALDDTETFQDLAVEALEQSETKADLTDKDFLLRHILAVDEEWSAGLNADSELEVLWTKACSLSVGLSASCTLFCVDGYIWCIAIDNEGVVAIQHVSNTTLEDNKLYFADIDGDGHDEIIAHFGTTAAGGSSRHASIYQWQEDANGLVIMYSNDWEYQELWIDLGFTMTLADGFQCILGNEHTGERTVYDAQQEIQLPDLIFDADGRVDDTHPLYNIYFQRNVPYPDGDQSNNFLVFEPVDIDGDGVYEIRASKQFAMGFQMPVYIGDATTVLRYDQGKEGFQVVSAEFTPA